MSQAEKVGAFSSAINQLNGLNNGLTDMIVLFEQHVTRLGGSPEPVPEAGATVTGESAKQNKSELERLRTVSDRYALLLNERIAPLVGRLKDL